MVPDHTKSNSFGAASVSAVKKDLLALKIGFRKFNIL